MDKKKWKMIACHGRRNSSCASVAQQQIVPVFSSVVRPPKRPPRGFRGSYLLSIAAPSSRVYRAGYVWGDGMRFI